MRALEVIRVYFTLGETGPRSLRDLKKRGLVEATELGASPE